MREVASGLLFILHACILLTVSMVADAHCEIYIYDELDRIKSVIYQGGAEISYSYDNNGNRLTHTRSGAIALQLTSSVPSPQFRGQTIIFIASATGGTGVYEYRFWLDNGIGYTLKQEYNSLNTFTWDTSDLKGAYSIKVDVRNAGVDVDYDASQSLVYTINIPPVEGVSLVVSPSSLNAIGNLVSLSATGWGGLQPYYFRFRIINPLGTTIVDTGYTHTSTYNWNTVGVIAGSYVLRVDAISYLSDSSSEAFQERSYAMNIPVAKILGASPEYYSSIQAAYDAALGGTVIRCVGTNTYETLYVNKNISVTIAGGYTPDFAGINGQTNLHGEVHLLSGTAEIKDFILD